MSILGEHPQRISEKCLEYLLHMLKEEGSSMLKLSALTVIHQLLVNDPKGDIKSLFLQNGILEYILADFDTGLESEDDGVFLDISLNILWNFSKLPVCLLQPLISDVVIRRLISLFDISTSFYSFPMECTTMIKNVCENKHLVGHVSSQLISVKVKDDIRIATNNKLKNLKKCPDEIQICRLYDTNDPENELDITNHLIINKLAWCSNDNDVLDQVLVDDSPGSWKDFLVTEVIGGPYFWAHIGIDTIENVRMIQNLLQMEYTTGRLNHVPCVKDSLVVVAKEVNGDVCFFRAQVMKQKLTEVKVWTLDYGFILDVPVNKVFNMPSNLELPSQVQLCCIKGVQPQPRDPVMVQLAASILCNLTYKSIITGDIMIRHDGFEQLNNFLKECQDHNINKEVLKLLTNLSFAERKRQQWLETDIIQTLLEKVADPANMQIYPNLVNCLSNMIVKCAEAREKFYQSQGIDIILKVIIKSQENSTTYKACVHILKVFVQRVGIETTDGAQVQPKSHKSLSNNTSLKNKIIMNLEDSDLIQGEIKCSIPEDRLSHNLSCDDKDDQDIRSCDYKGRPTSSTDFKQKIIKRNSSNSNLDASLPVNACIQSFDSKKYFIKDEAIDFHTDSLHELRPNTTLDNVSSTVIATHVCGMLNNRKGGKIIFGISTTSRVVGVKATRDERDEFRIGVDKMMTDKLFPPALHSLFDMEYHQVVKEDENTGELLPLQDLYVIIINVKPSKGVLYTLRTDNSSYIRFGATTSPLSVQDMRNLVILEEEDRYRSQIIELRQKLQQLGLKF